MRSALAVLAFVFASMLAFLPLVVAAASILASFVLLLSLTYLGNFSVLVEFLIALIGLGVAIGYSLLLVTRWREEHHRGRDNHDAVVVAMQSSFTLSCRTLGLFLPWRCLNRTWHAHVLTALGGGGCGRPRHRSVAACGGRGSEPAGLGPHPAVRVR